MYLKIKENKDKNPNVLWCHKKDRLDFNLDKNKQNKKQQNDEFFESSFINKSNSIKTCQYKDSQLILGNTFDILVIQDFEALTPNILCRIIETVSGNGFIVLLMNKVSNFREIFELNMDVHNKFKTVSHSEVNRLTII
jgi:N-acetyltransferase 10